MQSPNGKLSARSGPHQQPSSPLRPAGVLHRTSPCTSPAIPCTSSSQPTPSGLLAPSSATSCKRGLAPAPLTEALNSLSVGGPYSPMKRLGSAGSPRASPSKGHSPGMQSRLRGQALITKAAACDGPSDMPPEGRSSDSGTPSQGYPSQALGATFAAQAVGGHSTGMIPDTEELPSQADAVQELRQSWASFKEMLGEMVTRVTSLQKAVSQLDEEHEGATAAAAAAQRRSPQHLYEDEEEYNDEPMTKVDLKLLEYEQAMATRDVQQIGHYLKTGDHSSVQGALVILMDYLNGQRLTAAHVLQGGLLPLITRHINPSLDETTGVALEAMNALLKSEMVMDGPTDALMASAAAPVMSVLEQCVNQLTWQQAGPSRAAAAAARLNQLYHSALQRASVDEDDTSDVPAPARTSSPALSDNAAQTLQVKESSGWTRRFARSRAPSPQVPAMSSYEQTSNALGEICSRRGANAPSPFQSQADEAPVRGDAPAAASHNEHATIVAFYAVSVTMRLARFPSTARELVKRGGVRFLARGLNVTDPCLQQVCLLALCKLVKVGSHADNLVHVLQSGAVSVLYSMMSGRKTQRTTQAHLYYNRLHLTPPNSRSASENQSSGSAGVKPDALPQPSAPVRDMSAALLLDMALLPEAPTHTADNGLVAPLVQMLSQSTEAVTRMYGLLVLARLASRSRPVQLDAVREGAVPFLTQMMTAGTDDEALHAARLLAILAQATPTHEAISKPEVMCALTTLLSSQCPQVVEHATSVFAIMANNPDTHFQVVGWGIIPLLVPLLAVDPPTPAPGASASAVVPGSKTQTYVLATLLLLAMHETRHADVVCRAGALPHLVRLLRHGSSSNVREYAAAVVSSLCHTVDIQMEVIAAGGVPALIHVLSTDEPQAQGHAAEALVQMAVVEDHRKRLIIRAGEILDALMDLLSCSLPASQYWGATLMQLLCQDETVLAEVSQMPGLVEALHSIIENQGPGATTELRRAQVQACWLINRLAADPHVAKALVSTDILRPLVYMLSLGWESVQRGAGGALHVMLGSGPDALGGTGSVGIIRGEPGLPVLGTASEPAVGGARAQMIRIEPLDSNGHAAAAAALLSLARNNEGTREAVHRELILQEAGFGRRVTLAGLYAPSR